MSDLDLCTDGFHSDECPGCGLTAEQRDGDMLAVNSAMDYGQGRADAEAEIARLREALAALDMERLARAIQRTETPIGAIYPPIRPFIERATAIAREYAALAQPEGDQPAALAEGHDGTFAGYRCPTCGNPAFPEAAALAQPEGDAPQRRLQMRVPPHEHVNSDAAYECSSGIDPCDKATIVRLREALVAYRAEHDSRLPSSRNLVCGCDICIDVLYDRAALAQPGEG